MPEPGVRHRRHHAVPAPLAEAKRRSCEGRDDVGDGREAGGAAHYLPESRGR